MSLAIWGLLAFLSRTFTAFRPTRRPPPEPFRPQYFARSWAMTFCQRGFHPHWASLRTPALSRYLHYDDVQPLLCKVVSDDSLPIWFPFFATFHDVQPRSPTTSSTHRPSPNIDDNQDLLTTSLDRGRPRMGEAWSNEPFSSNVKSRLGLFDTSFENIKASRQHSVLGLLPKSLRSYSHNEAFK